MKQRFLILNLSYFLFFFYSCKNTETKKESNLISENEIVVLTESDNPNNPLYIGKLPTLENYNNREYITNKPFDTLKINVLSWDLLTIGAKKNYLDTLLIKRGDTLTIKLRNGELSKSFKSRKVEKWNYRKVLKSNQVKQYIDSLYFTFFEKTTFPKGTEPLILDAKKYLLLIPTDYKFKPTSLNSALSQAPSIIEKYRELIKQYDEYNQKNIKDQDKIKLLNSLMRKHIFNNLYTLYSMWKTPDIKDFLLSDSVFLINEESRPEEQYSFLNQRINLLYIDYNSNTHFLNAKELYTVYETIPNNFDSIWIEKAKMICIERMIMEKGSVNSIIEYFDDFNENYSNKEFKNYIEDQYLIDTKRLYDAPYNIDFVDKQNKASNWNALKTSLAGKVIYVDYWASWCAPCIRAMPFSRKLKESYKGQNVDFVYFSIDENKDKWFSAFQIEKMSQYEHNYLVLNHNASNVENELKIQSIPRYLLYDKSGKLVNHDTPGPETEEIKILINSLLDVQ